VHEGGFHADFHNALIKRDHFIRHGMFDEHLPYISGFEFGARLHQRGEQMHYVPEINVSHANHVHITTYCQAIYHQGHNKAVLGTTKGLSYLKSYFPTDKFVRSQRLIRTLRWPLLIGTTLYYHIALFLYSIALFTKQRRMAEFLFMQAAIQAHRRGQLHALASNHSHELRPRT